MYADDILLYKSINCLEDYRGLREDIDVIYECTSACHLPLNLLKCKYLIASRKQQPDLTAGGLLLGDYTGNRFTATDTLIGVLVTSTLTWKDHIQQICTKARKLVGLLYRQFSTWADIKIVYVSTLLV